MIPKYRFRSCAGMHEVVEIDFKNQRVWLSDGDQRDIASGVLIQFTGFLDKDKKEIYEGDILGWNHLGEMQVEGVIAYDRGLLRIVFNQTNGAFEELHKANLNLLEVVGNIHENPELINT